MLRVGQLSKDQLWIYFLLAARVLLTWTLLSYGWAKLTDTQFGVDKKTMDLPLKDIDLFRLSWYLADHQPFKAFVGVSQLATALLLLFNRTATIGAFVSIPIWLNILVWDMTFMKGITAAFTFRLSFYIILTILIIYQSRDRVIPAMWGLTESSRISVKYPLWAYILLPVAAIGVEVIGALPNAILSAFRLAGK